MKIYTKNGDRGKTTLVGGSKIYKDDDIVEAYGTIDELISEIGFIESFNIYDKYKDLCFEIQNKLMLCAANVADVRKNKTVSDITEKDVEYLEKQIDNFDKDLKPLTNFILFRGSISSKVNKFRTLTRRAERRTIKIKNDTYNKNIKMVIKYLNRLSDLFFTMARHICLKYNCSEEVWKG
jgi:cob(I)alamin adenosyltransferase